MQGYIPGLTQQQAANREQPAFSRADDLFTPVRQLDEMLETKRILLDDVRKVCGESGYYEREHARLSFQRDQIQAALNGLEARRANGPTIIQRLQAEIAELEAKRAASENKSVIQRFLDMTAAANALRAQLGEGTA